VKRLSTGSALKLKGRKFYGVRGFKGKPFHPPLTDLPVAAYIIAPILDVIAYIWRDRSWAEHANLAAGYVFLAGAAFSLLTVATGFADWLDTDKDTLIRRMANAHAWTMILTTLLVLSDLGARFLRETSNRTDVLTLVLSLAVAVVVTLGAAIGGSLVFDYGFNVRTAKDDPAYHPDQEATV